MTVTDTPGVLQLERHFDAPPERVFDAWLSKDWGDWLPPPGATCRVTEIAPETGGRYRVEMLMGDGRSTAIVGVYRQITRPERIVLTWLPDYNNEETVITVTFHPESGGTRMRLRQEGFADTGQRDGYGMGWSGPGGSFDKLAKLLA